MIDLDLLNVTTPTLRQWAKDAPDDVTRAIFRAALIGRGDPPTFQETVIMPITDPVDLQANGTVYQLQRGHEVTFTATQVQVTKPLRGTVEVIKQTEDRYTLSAWYIPDSVDAHEEWTDADTLQKSAWEYVKSGNRTVYLQHDRNVSAGEWVELMSWPEPVTLGKATGHEPREYPKGTVFMGVQWEPWAWQLVKEGRLRGLSIGGWAVRQPDRHAEQ